MPELGSHPRDSLFSLRKLNTAQTIQEHSLPSCPRLKTSRKKLPGTCIWLTTFLRNYCGELLRTLRNVPSRIQVDSRFLWPFPKVPRPRHRVRSRGKRNMNTNQDYSVQGQAKAPHKLISPVLPSNTTQMIVAHLRLRPAKTVHDKGATLL